jgi:hypothetical protein
MRWSVLVLVSCGNFETRPVDQRGGWFEVSPPPNAPNEQCFVWTNLSPPTTATNSFGGPICRPRKETR